MSTFLYNLFGSLIGSFSPQIGYTIFRCYNLNRVLTMIFVRNFWNNTTIRTKSVYRHFQKEGRKIVRAVKISSRPASIQAVRVNFPAG